MKENPFGAGNTGAVWNNREGETPGTEIPRHDDEPIVMGEANLDSSSEEGSDAEETPEDRARYSETLARAESRAQISQGK
jgi:hypothetical protein